MPSVTVRNLPDEVHRAIRVRAAQHGRSIEAEMRDILESAVKPQTRVKLGSMLAEPGRKLNLSEAELTTLERARKPKSTARAASFE
jgi:plasmid stability protein